MGKLMDLSGMVFGNLTVLERTGATKNYQAIWKCQCECGNTTEVRSTHLTHGHTKSCGCKQGYRLQAGEAGFNNVYSNYVRNARVAGREFSITKEQARILFSGNCYYCQTPPSNVMNRNNNGDFVYNGIDRVDNSIGYTIENCVSCCANCNYLKKNVSVNIAKKIVEFIDGR